uniref:Translation factor GUF1, mitochondrial isoform X2 n=1 Tax=Petromyzon marinus TaxID=7757 RepID=A0AAJ7U6Q3_PETMA|nr:translation factor GUF1, mitochondrial isoform X2 [Petromyzon marinus]
MAGPLHCGVLVDGQRRVKEPRCFKCRAGRPNGTDDVWIASPVSAPNHHTRPAAAFLTQEEIAPLMLNTRALLLLRPLRAGPRSRLRSGHGVSTRSYSDEAKVPDLSLFPMERIRNFSIVAHVDHGKSTLADRLLEITGAIQPSSGNKQVLDTLQVERERGITVKAQTATLFHSHAHTRHAYMLNLIDTPGHVDFNYEVSRSLAACQGVLLLVDANEGIQAQTVANFYLAFEAELAIIPVINKIDLKAADPDRVAAEIEKLFDIPASDCIRVSAKLGTNVEQILEAVIDRIPPPRGDATAPFRALLFASEFDSFRGAVARVMVRDGAVSRGDRVRTHSSSTSSRPRDYEVSDIGLLLPLPTPTATLYAGQVGYLVCGMRQVTEAQVGDTLHSAAHEVEPLPGFKPSKPMVFAGMFPSDQSEYTSLRSALERLTLRDSSVSVQRESSAALGAGWRLGFLGLLHLDVFQQRLEQEYNTSVILTAPTVPYRAVLTSPRLIKEHGSADVMVLNPCELPDRSVVSHYLEPMITGTIITPDAHMGAIMKLCQERRGTQVDVLYMDGARVMLRYRMPLCEVLVDFYDILKSLSSGYASFDYEEAGYEPVDIVRMDVMLNGKPVEELTNIVHRDKAHLVGKEMCIRLRDSIPRQMFEVAIQATIGSKVIARETIKAFRKNVLAKCYGGDISRKMKLLKRQAEGKKRMREVGGVPVPRGAVIAVLTRSPARSPD